MTDETTTPEVATENTDEVATPPQFKFGFVVLVDQDGGVFIEKNPSILSVPVEREASLIEVRRYSS